ncbi:aldehyde dehydrogenase family protein [Bifidobacterium cuniculi]|uniref:Aldehyde dehydrogenase n=1 Tax=Bifidobacterium cuniculi TaxID=1688 RepID=A0A087ATE1_9BIFI|nr:aldehyde dehydrogenase family protein [Bifidobacterium cuniculi]KFI62041.1 aldehyde dehydrogenase [Bifidobacterium cuniculi]
MSTSSSTHATTAGTQPTTQQPSRQPASNQPAAGEGAPTSTDQPGTFTSLEAIQAQAEAMRAYFLTGATRDIAHRKQALRDMKSWLKEHETNVLKALWQDLGKVAYEGYITELGMVYGEIDLCLKKVDAWATPERVPSPVSMFKSISTVYHDPYGVVLVLAPWNYPLQLTLVPMVDAIAAGNCVAFKPAREAPATAAIMFRMAREVFDPTFVCAIPGGPHINDWVLATRWDSIMFTGSPRVGKVVMAAAAQFLTPVTLELGGKSPCIVHSDADLKVAAKRIAWGKTVNSGQTCVAPDYLLVQEDVADDLLAAIADTWNEWYDGDALHSPIWPHMVSMKHYKRVMGLIEQHNPAARVAVGGHGDPDTLRIEPTIMTGVTLDDPVMGEEIFGPVLPVLTYSDLDDAFATIRRFEHPLACYVYTASKEVKRRVIGELQFGGGAVNDCCVQLSNDQMGFGGVGNSGMGAYHGKVGFDAFTHYKGVMDHAAFVDPDFRYPPFTAEKKRLAKGFMH